MTRSLKKKISSLRHFLFHSISNNFNSSVQLFPQQCSHIDRCILTHPKWPTCLIVLCRCRSNCHPQLLGGFPFSVSSRIFAVARGSACLSGMSCRETNVFNCQTWQRQWRRVRMTHCGFVSLGLTGDLQYNFHVRAIHNSGQQSEEIYMLFLGALQCVEMPVALTAFDL